MSDAEQKADAKARAAEARRRALEEAEEEAKKTLPDSKHLDGLPHLQTYEMLDIGLGIKVDLKACLFGIAGGIGVWVALEGIGMPNFGALAFGCIPVPGSTLYALIAAWWISGYFVMGDNIKVKRPKLREKLADPVTDIVISGRPEPFGDQIVVLHKGEVMDYPTWFELGGK